MNAEMTGATDIPFVNLWNNLPSSTTDFTSFCKFDKSLNNDYLLLYVNCKLLSPMHDFIHIVYTVLHYNYCILYIAPSKWPLVILCCLIN